MDGHDGKAITTVEWHPMACDVLASAGADGTARLWNVAAANEKVVLTGATDAVTDIAWSPDGSQLATVSKDGKLRIYDARKNYVVAETEAHGKSVALQVVWPSAQRVVTSGAGAERVRELKTWDTGAIQRPLGTVPLEAASNPAVLYVDRDAKLLFVASRGETVIKSFEFRDNDAPHLFALEAFVASGGGAPHLGVGFAAPKRALDHMACEVVRSTRVTKDSLERVQWIVPRRTHKDFPEDLFPETLSNVPSNTTDEWFMGVDRPAYTISLKPAPRSRTGSLLAAPAQEDARSRASSQAPLSAAAQAAMGVVRSSNFRHMKGQTVKPQLQYNNVRVFSATAEMNPIAASSKFFCVPWVGPGGRVAVIPHDLENRRLASEIPMIETTSPVFALEWSPFDDNQLSVGNEDGHIRIYQVPDGGYDFTQKNPETEKDIAIDLRGHYRKISSLKYHPVADGILASGSYDCTVKLWNLEEQKEVFSVGGFEDTVLSLSFSDNGSSIASWANDKQMRITDSRSGEHASTVQIHEGTKGCRVCWLPKKDQILTTGFDKTSMREIRLWDVRNLSESIAVQTIDVSSGIINPIYDEDSQCVWLAGKGDGSVRYYEINNEAPHIHFLAQYQTGNPAQGVCALPKKSVDIKGCEIIRLLKLTPNNSVEPMPFTVPRRRLEFWQDDLYPDSKVMQPQLSANDWIAGQNADPVYHCLQPEGMKRLSLAPKVFIEKKEIIYNQPGVGSGVGKKEVFDSFEKKLDGIVDEAEPLKQDLLEGVDDDEWGDSDEDGPPNW